MFYLNGLVWCSWFMSYWGEEWVYIYSHLLPLQHHQDSHIIKGPLAKQLAPRDCESWWCSIRKQWLVFVFLLYGSLCLCHLHPHDIITPMQKVRLKRNRSNRNKDNETLASWWSNPKSHDITQERKVKDRKGEGGREGGGLYTSY